MWRRPTRFRWTTLSGLIVGLIEAIKDFNEAKVEENSTISKFLIENDEVGLE